MLYFLKDEKTGGFWAGRRYRGTRNDKEMGFGRDSGWSHRVQFFKSPAALSSSFRVIPRAFMDPFIKRNGVQARYPETGDKDREAKWKKAQDWYVKRTEEYAEWLKGVKSIGKLKSLAGEGFVTMQLEEGKALKQAKPL